MRKVFITLLTIMSVTVMAQKNQTYLTLNNARANESHKSVLSNGRVQPSIVLNNGVKMPQFGLGVYSIPDGDETYNSVMAAKHNIQIECWFPLGGRDSKGELLRNPVICDIAKAHGKSPAQIIIRWHMQMGFSVIPGASNPDYIKEKVQS